MQTCPSCQRMYRNEEDYLKDTSGWRICDQNKLWFHCSCNQLLFLPEGQHGWFDPAMTMPGEARSVFEVLRNKSKLPHLPSATFELQMALTNDKLNSDQLALIAKKDPVLSAEILALSTAAMSVSGQQITSLSHGITYLGRKKLSELCMIAAVKAVRFQTHHFNPDDFWSESVLTGQIAEIVAKTVGSKEHKDMAFVGGALCNLGKVVTAVCLPKEADLVFDYIRAPKTQTNWLEAEKKLSVPDHLVLGEVAARFWGLPAFVLDSAKGHHDGAFEKETETLEIREVIAVANQVCHWIQLDAGMVDHRLLKDILSKVGMRDESSIDDFVSKIRSQLQALSA